MEIEIAALQFGSAADPINKSQGWAQSAYT